MTLTSLVRSPVRGLDRPSSQCVAQVADTSLAGDIPSLENLRDDKATSPPATLQSELTSSSPLAGAVGNHLPRLHAVAMATGLLLAGSRGLLRER